MLAHRLLLLLLIWTAASSSAFADEEPLSLDAAVRTALEVAPQVNAQVANRDAMQSLAVSAGRLPDPELIVGLDNLPVTGPDAYSATSDFMTMRKVGVMQEFPRAAKRKLQREQAAAEVTTADAQLVESRLAVARQVAQSWIRRATAEESLRDLQALVADVELQASAARSALAAGRGSAAEALAAQSAVAQVHNRVLKAQGEVRRAASELARWIGTDAGRTLAAMPSLDDLPTLPSVLLANVHEHGSLLPLQAQIEAARLNVDLAQAARRPDWSAEIEYAKRGAEFSDMVSLQFRVGLPLFSKYRQDPVTSAKRAQLRQLEAEREAELRMHTAEVQQTIAEWEQLGQQLEQFERELLPLARERSQAALAAYRSGRDDLGPALDAYAEEVDSIIEHAQLKNERGRAWAFLRYLGPEHLHR